jgi:chromate transporter
VVQFVAFLGGYHHPGTLDPWLAGVLASALTTWVTFVPCFLFVLLGAPWVERLRGNRALSAALTGITAAVVGVIAHLGVYFAGHTLVAPDGDVLVVPVAITGLAAALIFWLGWPVLRVLAVCAGAGLGAWAAGLTG